MQQSQSLFDEENEIASRVAIHAVAAPLLDSFIATASRPVLVDFWAPWCAPCHAISVHLERIAERFAGQLEVCKLDVDSAPEIAAEFGIRGIPTLILFRDGKPVSQRMGVQSERELLSWISAESSDS